MFIFMFVRIFFIYVFKKNFCDKFYMKNNYIVIINLILKYLNLFVYFINFFIIDVNIFKFSNILV